MVWLESILSWGPTEQYLRTDLNEMPCTQAIRLFHIILGLCHSGGFILYIQFFSSSYFLVRINQFSAKGMLGPPHRTQRHLSWFPIPATPSLNSTQFLSWHTTPPCSQKLRANTKKAQSHASLLFSTDSFPLSHTQLESRTQSKRKERNNRIITANKSPQTPPD